MRFTVRHELLAVNRKRVGHVAIDLRSPHLRIANDYIPVTILCCHLLLSSFNCHAQTSLTPGS